MARSETGMICAALVLIALSISTAAQTQEKRLPCEQVTSIGVANMATHGTITLRVRSLLPGPIQATRCPVLAQSGHASGFPQCLLIEEKRTHIRA